MDYYLLDSYSGEGKDFDRFVRDWGKERREELEVNRMVGVVDKMWVCLVKKF